MADRRYTLMNATGAMLCANLDTLDDRGRRASVILMDREKTRPLTDTEYRSREVQKLLRRGDLRDVSAIDDRRKAAAEAAPRGGRLRMPDTNGDGR